MSTVNQTTESPYRETDDASLREDARSYVEQLRAFRVHAGVFAGSMVVIFSKNLFVNLAAGITGDLGAWWSLWAFMGWGLGVATHGLVVRAARSQIFGSTWEDEQTSKIVASTSGR